MFSIIFCFECKAEVFAFPPPPPAPILLLLLLLNPCPHREKKSRCNDRGVIKGGLVTMFSPFFSHPAPHLILPPLSSHFFPTLSFPLCPHQFSHPALHLILILLLSPHPHPTTTAPPPPPKESRVDDPRTTRNRQDDSFKDVHTILLQNVA